MSGLFLQIDWEPDHGCDGGVFYPTTDFADGPRPFRAWFRDASFR